MRAKRAGSLGRVAQPGLGTPPQKDGPFAPGLAFWPRDIDQLLSTLRRLRTTPSGAHPGPPDSPE